MPKSEFELIDWIKANSVVARGDIALGIGDDMAIMVVGDEKVLITTDMLLEGVHFDLQKATLEQVGYKTMAVSLSDCAAMAAVPWCAVVAVALPRSWSMDQAQRLHAGLQQAAQKYNCPLVGGDTTSWDKPLAINLTMLAKAEGIEPVRRSGAQVGDALFVTGELGGSLAGHHLTFEPRVAEARQLAQLAQLHAMIDLSDGLASDLGHICRQSNVAALIDATAIPISMAARQTANPLKAALSDGEDFELIFCVSPTDARTLETQWLRQSGVRLTRIGMITQTLADAPRIHLRQANGQTEPLTYKGWEHFRD